MRPRPTGLALAASLAACAAAPDPASLDWDPFEARNREVHATNTAVDQAAFGPVARAWGETVPAPVRRGVGNLRDHWRLPGHAVQYGLQGRPVRVLETATRFAVNSVFGLAGLLDPAAEMDLPYRETGFDETFFVWGIPEGGYVELAAGGPGTQRDWTGYLLDQLLDPVYYVLPGAATTGLFALGGLDIVNDRYELDPVLAEIYASEDSYVALRIGYLQNMRARLKGGTDLETLEDVYADF